MIDVVLVHAFPFDARLWSRQQAAAPEGVRVHAFDLPGFGASLESEPCTSIDAMADAVHSSVRSLGLDRFVLGGMSMGGYVALAYCRRHGADGQLRGLVLADTRAEADDETARRGRDDTLRLVREQGLRAFADRQVPKLLAPDAPPERRELVRAWIECQDPEAVVAATLALRDREDSTPMLPHLRLPTLVVGGTEDVLTPPDGMRAMAERIPQAQWAPIAGAGHLSNLDQPETFNRVLFHFLRGLA